MKKAHLRTATLLLLLSLITPLRANLAPAGVAVLLPVAWSAGDSARAGAGEFEVLLRIAQLQRASRAVGIVSVGDRHGARAGGGERALTRATLSGVAVVKLAPTGEVAAAAEGVFLNGGRLSVEQVSRILAAELEIRGSPPAVADAERPAAHELAAIRRHLESIQAALDAAAGQTLAMR